MKEKDFNSPQIKRALPVVVYFEKEDYAPEEFLKLIKSANYNITESVRSKLSRIDAKTFLGKGLVEQTYTLSKELAVDVVLINKNISASQQRNLRKSLKCDVLDWTGLILEIFSLRARSFEGRMQVELAQLRYLSTRLIRGWTHLERQKGGHGLRGGPGETQLEIDRRLLTIRITQVKERLVKIKKQRELSGGARRRGGIPTVALVGYTNAGKSSLFLALSGKEVLVEDKLFSTLETTVGRMEMSPRVLLADTIGFIDELPSDLLDAFHATLDESLQCDLLLLLADCSDSLDELERKLSTSRREVLDRSEDGVLSLKVVLTKSDLGGDVDAAKEVVASMGMSEPMVVSSHDGTGLDELRESIMYSLYGPKRTVIVSQGNDGQRSPEAYVNQIYNTGIVTSKNGFELTLWCGDAELQRLISKSEGRISIK